LRSTFHQNQHGTHSGLDPTWPQLRFRVDNTNEAFAVFCHGASTTIGGIADSGGPTTVYNTSSDMTLQFDDRSPDRARLSTR
jgi:hypothetical protein